ncbi:hypothetical protein D3C86_1731160 [compost metagenome]
MTATRFFGSRIQALASFMAWMKRLARSGLASIASVRIAIATLAPFIARSSAGHSTVSASKTSWQVFDTTQICLSGFMIIIASTLFPTVSAV